jgi:hypothetical protein
MYDVNRIGQVSLQEQQLESRPTWEKSCHCHHHSASIQYDTTRYTQTTACISTTVELLLDNVVRLSQQRAEEHVKRSITWHYACSLSITIMSHRCLCIDIDPSPLQ